MASSFSWLRPLPARRGAARRRLICFPHAGGAANSYRGWAELMPASVEVVAVQYPGRQDRCGEPFVASIAELADRIAALVQDELDRPTAFFGHSMGAIVAYETARRLTPRFPTPLTALIVSARKAPGTPPAGLPATDAQLRDYVRRLGGAGAGIVHDDAVWELIAPPLRHDLNLVRAYTYVPGAPLTCPIVSIVGEQDSTVSAADAARWAPHTMGAYTAYSVPGGHFYLDSDPARLARLLTGVLDPSAAPVAEGADVA
ncbi:thioesterase II family protein [Salinispora pacifica]|uniref:thioesterase II family protein n=1 Tax=Salinispora pacifica TaxID=351187 RepID=UPI000378197D|nr:alpha/beta fold hydrolase [Salinispora pacifica]